ncbi:poly [ADP-ribose] polymerase 1-like [Lingula anatina]|uniref:Poly [ADP-ribose] polymerase n=1 Tax=Lingula anatina TaxID=7574 RepID=A0A1S3JN87_LINAN|nr:poly [ADP-ribose] polymerase 1-like [Lingula anatina]|eukprot:XP_013411414.1 poly [ADP-ribose] polymerase 1-like [Lingula anatina]
MADHHDLPFKAEYAKSNRASCKKCKELISKDTLRLAVMVQSPHFDGKIPNWFHYKCFWTKAKVLAAHDIHGFDALRWDDQKKIKDHIEGGGGGDAAPKGGSTAGDDAAYKDFCVEYAKSNRSKCRGCEEKIEKDAVRISMKEYESERAKMYGPQDRWHHVDCFVENRDELQFSSDMNPDKIPGYKSLKKEDKEMVKEKLGAGSSGKKRKGDKKKEVPNKKAKKEETEEEKALKEQSEMIWKIRDNLQKAVSNVALKGLLDYNDQQIPSGESKLLDNVADCMAFGALKNCPECKEGQLVYSSDGYKCTGNLSAWTKCMYVTKNPARKAFKIPTEYHDVEFLKKYKYVKKERVWPKVSVVTTEGPISSSGVALGTDKPLHNMKFVIIGRTKMSKDAITKAVNAMGGMIVSKLDKTVAACISSEAEVQKNSKKIQEAKSADVHVVSEDFLEAAKKGGAVLMIKEKSICDWGSDPASRLGDVVDGPVKSGGKSAYEKYKTKDSVYTKKVPDKMKMMVKGGAAVDPDTELGDTAHVVEDKGDIYNAVLGLVDIVRGTNSYYKIQALESDTSNRWWLFKAWGRVGTTIGGNRLDVCGSKSSAISKFKEVYLDKTGNMWEDRKNFVKYPNKFYPLEIDYGQEEEEIKEFEKRAGTSSKLPKEVQDLIKMIFNVESMKKAMLEFEIDLKKMPLGKLSKKQIEQAYKVLTELQQLAENNGTPGQFLDASNRFYTLIPHDFGMRKPPLLDTSEVIKKKIEMLDNLLEIEVAYNLLKSGASEDKDPVDAHYEQLKCKMEVVEKESNEFKLLQEYTKNTHAATHNMYDLEVMEVFKVAREGEYARYKPFRDLHNKMLLWHGSRVTNFAGILSQGLRIAPPEAPVTGYMFGKGIYFADMVSKSANYCRTSKSEPHGILLLCEVALGNMHECRGAEYITKLPKGKHSTKGLGMTMPDPKDDYKTPEDVIIPKGKGISAPIGQTSLLYNEFIVYDVAQVNIKYLLKMNFKYKW